MPGWAAVNVTMILDAQGISLAAKVLLIAARLECADRETNGLIRRGQLVAIAEAAEVEDPLACADELVLRGFWKALPFGWLDATFLDDNASREERERERRRVAAWRKKHPAKKGRDGQF